MVVLPANEVVPQCFMDKTCEFTVRTEGVEWGYTRGLFGEWVSFLGVQSIMKY